MKTSSNLNRLFLARDTLGHYRHCGVCISEFNESRTRQDADRIPFKPGSPLQQITD